MMETGSVLGDVLPLKPLRIKKSLENEPADLPILKNLYVLKKLGIFGT